MVKIKIETPLIAVMIIGVIFAGVWGMFIHMADVYEHNYDLSLYQTKDNRSFDTAFNKINSTKNNMDNLSQEFEDLTVSESSGVWGWIQITWKMAKQVFNSLNLLKDLAYFSSEILGIHPYIPMAFFTIIIVLFIISVVMILAGRLYQ